MSGLPARVPGVLVRTVLILVCGLALGCTRERREPTREGGVPSPTLAPLEAPFVYSTESVADVRILRYRVRGFDALSLRQKTLLYYLQEAALSGRDITYDQKYEHNLAVRRTLEAIVVAAGGGEQTKDSADYKALLGYLKRVWLSNGVHHHASSRKFVPEGLSPEAFAGFVKKLDPKAVPRLSEESVDDFIARITPIIFDPSIAAIGVNKDEARDPVADSANHFYVNLNRERVAQYTRNAAQAEAATRSRATRGGPISVGLNSQLVAKKDGSIEERVWRTSGMYGPALEECVRWLEKAQAIAENPAQATALAKLISFYRTGDLGDFDAYSIAWVEDRASTIDLIHGFIEVYGDAMGLRGTYEALVELVDADATKRIKALSEHAAWFEQSAPIDATFKKEQVVGIEARVVEVVLGAGDTAPVMPTGVNLPNATWIREQHGSKSVTLGNLLSAYQAEGRDNGVLEEFAADKREAERARSYGALAHALMVDMHEVLGHASGKLAEGVADVAVTLRHYGSTLEEARADLFALYYMLDPKLIELKLVPSLEVGRASYDGFLRGALIQQARVPEGETIEEAHMRNRQLIVGWVMQHGAEDGVVERIVRGEKTYFVVRDYPKLRKLFGRLLAEIQRIKSQGDLAAARDLVETYGVKLEPELHREIRARYAALNVPPYAGFLQPELKLITKADQIVDVQIEYPTDFASQQLRYSAKYSFLSAYP
jgi:dipeptidyl-peptidase-3